MAETFIWADDAGTVRVAWDGRDRFTVYDIATNEAVDAFTADAGTYPDAVNQARHWWAKQHE